ncbi:MAG: methyltransferase domain-containing protein [Desulfatiglans sp.]|jgi:ubiquinone/menaquinone biosynthesis C-methylase UbiE|nr:methyltransferase domain-containing protein [Thermodesulfobacteriota bacterium]MEE4354418.1 methyltransferase domain-containing protein [Desulfatiglans sp.]
MRHKKPIESIYELDTFETILLDSIHPGGLELTRHLVDRAGVGRDSILLDVACGKGASARFLSQTYGCDVVGIDKSSNMLRSSQSKAIENVNKMMFLQGEGQFLPFLNSIFDFILFECTFSIFENKKNVSDEAFRVLKPGGKLIITDFYLKKNSPEGLANSIFPCAAGAVTEKEYKEIFQKSGFSEFFFEDHSKELRKIYLDILLNFGSLENFCMLLSQEKSAFEELGPRPALFDYKNEDIKGKLGYGLLILTKS